MRFVHQKFVDADPLWGINASWESRSIAMDFGHHSFFLSLRNKYWE